MLRNKNKKLSLAALVLTAIISTTTPEILLSQEIIASRSNSENASGGKFPKKYPNLVIPEFNQSYHIVIPNFFIVKDAVFDSAASWKSFTTTNNEELMQVIDGKADIKIPLLYALNVEFKTKLSYNKKAKSYIPLESIVATRTGNSDLTSYDSSVARREFADWQNIRTISQMIFNYDRGTVRTPTNTYKKGVRDTLTYIDETVLDMQSAYFILVEYAFNTKSPSDTTINMIYNGTIHHVHVDVEDFLLEKNGRIFKGKKIIGHLTEKKTINGKVMYKPFFDGIEKLTLYVDEKTKCPVEVEAEVTIMFKLKPYAAIEELRN